jgi:hypothetical protein
MTPTPHAWRTRLTKLATLLAISLLAACEDDRPAPPGAATTLLIVDGDGQEAVVGTALPEPIVVRALDADGRAVAGTPVAFVVNPDVASTSTDTILTDGDGDASVVVTMGPIAGPVLVSVRLPGVTTREVHATALVGAPAEMIKWDGDLQLAHVGTAVVRPPKVRLRDAAGNYVAGAAVTFTVVTGGGTIAGGNAISDAQGFAVAGNWTVGPTRGENTVVATTDGVPPLTFRAVAGSVTSAINLSVPQPQVGEIVGDSLVVHLRVLSSTFSVTTATARIGALTFPMPWAGDRFVGATSIASLPMDSLFLVITAEDVMGNLADIGVWFIHDRPPGIEVVAPLPHSVAPGTVTIAATCSDDDADGCSEFTVSHSGQPIAQGTSAINGNFPVPSTGTQLTFRAVDSRGQVTELTQALFVESSNRLTSLLVGDGRALDYRNNVLLFVDSTSEHVRPVLRPAAGMDQVLAAPDEILPRIGFIVTDGAIIEADEVGSNDTHVHHWRNGMVSVTSDLESPGLTVTGDWAVFYVDDLIRRDLLTGADVSIASSNTGYDVAANGDVAFWRSADDGVFRYRGGVITRISDVGGPLVNGAPLTDGGKFVYFTRQAAGGATYRIVMREGGVEVELAPERADGPLPRRDYAVTDGWVAFTRPDAGGNLQVWTRSPAGTLRQVSFFGADARIESLAPNGSVVFSSGGRRYLDTGAGAPQDIMATRGLVRWRDSRFVVLLGRVAFEIN